MHCCGIKGPADYESVFHNSSLPNSCCTKFSPESNVCTQQNAIQEGCMKILLHFFESKSLLLAGVGIGIALIQVRREFLLNIIKRIRSKMLSHSAQKKIYPDYHASEFCCIELEPIHS